MFLNSSIKINQHHKRIAFSTDFNFVPPLLIQIHSILVALNQQVLFVSQVVCGCWRSAISRSPSCLKLRLCDGMCLESILTVLPVK